MSINNFVDLALDRPFYVAGEQINGSIILNTFEEFRCDQLELHIVGCERTNILVGKYNHRTSNNFVDSKVNIPEIHGDVKLGQLIVPFSFALSDVSPATFKAKSWPAACSGEITYTISARVRVKGMFKRDLNCSREFVIVQKAPELLTAAPHISSTQTINSLWRWLDAGSLTINCQVDKSAFTAGELCQLDAEVTNMSKEVISSIRVRLVKRLTFRTKGFLNNVDRTLTQELFSMDRRTEVTTGQTTHFKSTVNLPDIIVDPSAVTDLIDCQYTILIEAITRSSVASNSTLEYPVRIYTRTGVSERKEAVTQQSPQMTQQIEIAPPAYEALTQELEALALARSSGDTDTTSAAPPAYSTLTGLAPQPVPNQLPVKV